MSASDTDHTPADQNVQDQAQQGDEQARTFTQEELDATVSKRLNKERTKLEAKFEERLAQAEKEWERKAQLSDEERAKEAQAAKISELEKRERDITMRERTAEAITQLAQKEIPSELVNYVVDLDAEKMNSNIEDLAKVWNSALERGIKARTAGKTPDDIDGATSQGTSAGYTKSGGVTSF